MRRTNFTKKDQNVSSYPLENKELLEEKPLVEAADKSWEAPHFELDKITLNQSGTKKTKPNQWLDKNHILYIILAVLLLCGIGGGALFIRYADFLLWKHWTFSSSAIFKDVLLLRFRGYLLHP